ncbi:ATP-dependent endonuclease [Agromyces sp. NPDC127015]|uniref:ATP-dependent nuclease n=1 Tax=Agromyces sp. NPDC127015 TaxID=3347108 RepID=UPI00365C941A
MLRSLVLRNFKGFEQFTVRFGRNSLLVGPNNAGKSTIVAAIRLAAAAGKLASRRNPTDTFDDGGRTVRGFPISALTGSGFVAENVRHEFRNKEARVELTFTSGATLHLVWPTDDQPPFFWVTHPDGPNFIMAARAREVLTPIGAVPTLTPLEYDESKLGTAYIREKVETKLASRHFRNHLRNVKSTSGDEFADLLKFLLDNSPELSALRVDDDYRDGNVWIDVYYKDVGSAVDKEIYWAGDGLQIWLQLLFHIWRNRTAEVLVLDEPDVFLHPDLQRRLIRVLEENPQQAILASHAPEMASEAEQGSVVWVERARKTARRVGGDKDFGDLTDVLGSGFNLAVARALRSKVALFVEGDDMQLIRTVARRLKLMNLATEKNLTVIPIGGFSRWPGVEAFAWLKKSFLGSRVSVSLLLDRDYRTDEDVRAIEAQLLGSDVHAHIWRRKEIENYFLVPELIAGLTQLPGSECNDLLLSIAESFRNEVSGQLIAAEVAGARKGIDHATSIAAAMKTFEARWATEDSRLACIPGKRALALLNTHLQALQKPTVTARKLAARISLENVDSELANALGDIEQQLI